MSVTFATFSNGKITITKTDHMSSPKLITFLSSPLGKLFQTRKYGFRKQFGTVPYNKLFTPSKTTEGRSLPNNCGLWPYPYCPMYTL